MLPVNFEGAREIGKPASMTDDECMSLPIFQAFSERGAQVLEFAFADVGKIGPPYPFTLSCWQPSKEDIEAINRGEPIWVRILSHTVFPMSIFTLDAGGQINQ